MTTIKIWHPELKAVGESADDVFEAPNHPFRLRGWGDYPATTEDATKILGRTVHDLSTLSNAELIKVALASEKGAKVPEEASVKEILEWVGSDLGRAETALANEKTRDEPRKTLIADLEKMTTAS